MARLAFENLSDLGAVALLLRRSMELVLGSVLVALERADTSDDTLGDAAAALQREDIFADLQRVREIVEAVPAGGVVSSDARGAYGEALAAAQRITRAVEQFHEGRRTPRAGRHRRLALGLALVLSLGSIGFALYRFAPPSQGLAGVYYADMNFGRAVLRRLDPAVNFSWEYGSPAPSIPVDAFSVEWSGTLLVPETGKYVLSLNSDDGSRLYIDGKLVIDYWGEHGADEFREAALLLTEGRVPIRLRYFEKAQRALVKLHWRSKHIPRGPIAASYLRP